MLNIEGSNEHVRRSVAAAVLVKNGLPNNLFGGFDKLEDGTSKLLGCGLFANNSNEKSGVVEALIISSLRNRVTLQLMMHLMEIARSVNATEPELLEQTKAQILTLCVAARSCHTQKEMIESYGEIDFTCLDANMSYSWYNFLLPSLSGFILTTKAYLEFTSHFVQALVEIYCTNSGSHEPESKKLDLSKLRIPLPENFPEHLRAYFTDPQTALVNAIKYNDEIPAEISEFRRDYGGYFSKNPAPNGLLFSAYDLAKEIITAKGVSAENSYIVLVARKIAKAGIYLLNKEAKELFLQWANKHTNVIQDNNTILQLPDFQEYYPILMEELAVRYPATEKRQQSPFQLAQKIVEQLKLTEQTKVNFVINLARIIYRAGIHQLSDENAQKYIEKFTNFTALETKEKYFIFDVDVITKNCREFLNSLEIPTEKSLSDGSEDKGSNGNRSRRNTSHTISSSAEQLPTASPRLHRSRNRSDSKASGIVDELEKDSHYLRQRSKTESATHSSGEDSPTSRTSSNECLPVVTAIDDKTVVTVNPLGPKRLIALRLFDTKKPPQPQEQSPAVDAQKTLK